MHDIKDENIFKWLDEEDEVRKMALFMLLLFYWVKWPYSWPLLKRYGIYEHLSIEEFRRHHFSVNFSSPQAPFQNWAPNQPNHISIVDTEGQDCVEFDGEGGQWGDASCSVKKRFICEKTLRAPNKGGPRNPC